MSLEQTNTVDAIGIEKGTENVILTITDSLDWSSEHDHLLLLQEKLNAYLCFVESGEIKETYPQAHGRSVVIQVITQYPIPETVLPFFQRAMTAVEQAGIGFKFSQWVAE